MNNTIRVNNTVLTTLKVSQLRVNHNYQRLSSEKRIAAIAANFNWQNFGIVTVVKTNDDNIFEVTNGQHRLNGLKKHFGEKAGDIVVPVQIVSSDAAESFIGCNSNMVKPTPKEVFRAKISIGKNTSGGNTATKIEKICNKHGISFRFEKGRPLLGQTSAPNQFENIFNSIGDFQKFDDAVLFIKTAFSQDDGYVDPEALSSDFLAGLNLFFISTTFDIKKLIELLKVVKKPIASAIKKKAAVITVKAWGGRYFFLQTIAKEINNFCKKIK